MTIARNEIRTGLLVVVSVAALVGTLIYLGSPGVFVPQKHFVIYFDNASGLEPGAPVLLAGRRIGRLSEIYSPVPEHERPDPALEAMIKVEVDKSARIFKKVSARMTSPSLLGKPVIDFTSGEESSGIAEDGASFIGVRPPGLADAVPAMMKKLDPALVKVTETLQSLQETANNLNRLTKEGSDVPKALAEYRKFGEHLNELTGPESSLRRSLVNIENLTGEKGKFSTTLDNLATLTGPESDLAKTMANAKELTGPDSHLAGMLAKAEKFTGKLGDNKDLDSTLRNLRLASENLNRKLDDLLVELKATGTNLKQGSDTIKRQPWRLVWPATKKYGDEKKGENNAGRNRLASEETSDEKAREKAGSPGDAAVTRRVKTTTTKGR